MKKLMIALFLTALTSTASAEGFTLSSKTLGGQLGNEQVFSGFGCAGRNISPDLAWHNAPQGTRSFAVTVYDPDAPTGSGWWHWLVFNIPASVDHLVKNAGNLKKGLAPRGSVQSLTSFGQPGFGGACPPRGDRPHRYVFTVYALDVPTLDLNSKAMPALVGFYLNQHALAKASLMAYYGR